MACIWIWHHQYETICVLGFFNAKYSIGLDVWQIKPIVTNDADAAKTDLTVCQVHFLSNLTFVQQICSEIKHSQIILHYLVVNKLTSSISGLYPK